MVPSRYDGLIKWGGAIAIWGLPVAIVATVAYLGYLKGSAAFLGGLIVSAAFIWPAIGWWEEWD